MSTTTTTRTALGTGDDGCPHLRVDLAAGPGWQAVAACTECPAVWFLDARPDPRPTAAPAAPTLPVFPDPADWTGPVWPLPALDLLRQLDTRPGGHSAKNTRRAGAPNHRMSAQETPMMDASPTPPASPAPDPAPGPVVEEHVGFIVALGALLAANPHLPLATVFLARTPTEPHTVAVGLRGLPVPSLLGWIGVLDDTGAALDSTITATPIGGHHSVSITARLSGHRFAVTEPVHGLPPGRHTVTPGGFGVLVRARADMLGGAR